MGCIKQVNYLIALEIPDLGERDQTLVLCQLWSTGQPGVIPNGVRNLRISRYRLRWHRVEPVRIKLTEHHVDPFQVLDKLEGYVGREHYDTKRSKSCRYWNANPPYNCSHTAIKRCSDGKRN